jgi:hypothetical protein
MNGRALSTLVGLFISSTVLALILLPDIAHALVHNGTIDIDEAVATEQTVQIVRELRLFHPISFDVITPDGLAKMFAKGGPSQPTDAEIGAEGVAGSMLGLFQKGVDLKASSVEVLKSQLLAFYDFRSKKMVVIDGSAASQVESVAEQSGQRDFLGYLILAHELTHALQDQNFHLGDQFQRVRADGDRALALRSVAEGDATLSGWGYATGRMNASMVTTLTSHLDDATKAFALHPHDPSLAAYEYFNFPYSEGLRFVGEAYRRGGWSAVDALYQNPPQSTQQIIDPSLYFDHPTPPVHIEISGYETMLKGWQLAERDVWGELGMQVILQRNLGMNSPDVALARKWIGDRIVVLRKGKDFVVLWMVALRDADSARKFTAVYTRIINRTIGRHTPYRIECVSNTILVAAGGPARNPALAAAIWARGNRHNAGDATAAFAASSARLKTTASRVH